MKNFYVRFTISITAVILLLLLGTYCLYRSYYFTGIGSFLVVGTIIWNCFSYTKRIQKDIHFFLNNTQNNDDSIEIKINNYGQPFQLFFQTYKNIIESRSSLSEENHHLQQLLLTILDKTSAGIIVIPKPIETHTKIRYINRSAQNLLNIPPLNSWQRITDLVPSLKTSITEIENGGKIFLTISEDKQFSIEGQLIISNNQSLLLLTLQDIKSEMDSKETDSWNKLIQVMTHEILNSLTPINTMSFVLEGLAKQEELNEEDKEDLQIASRTISNRSKGLMQFVQDYRKVAELPIPQKIKIRILPFLENILHLFQKELQQNNIQFELSCPDDQDVFWADQNQIEQAIVNLLANAIHAVNMQTQPQIHLKVQHQMDALQILVSDNGKGITAEQQTQIFVPFYTTRNEGSGIGLSVVRNIMRMHNGTVNVQSQGENQGSTFILNFPYKY